jgi:Protein of unknown function (DUF3617)
MRPARHTFVFACLLATAATAQAQKLTPGLWENTISMKGGDNRMEAAMARMQEELAKMPPEQRKQMEAMMASRGMAMGGAGGAPNAVRVCISKEQAERNELPTGNDGRCTRDSLERSASTLKFKVTCTDPVGSGEGTFNFSSDKAYSGSMVMNVTRDGRAMRMEIQQQGKWLGADCGALKPRQ